MCFRITPCAACSSTTKARCGLVRTTVWSESLTISSLIISKKTGYPLITCGASLKTGTTCCGQEVTEKASPIKKETGSCDQKEKNRLFIKKLPPCSVTEIIYTWEPLMDFLL